MLAKLDHLVFDCETNGLLHELDKVWVLAVGELNTDEVTTYTDYDPDYPPLSAGIARLKLHTELGGKLVAHNGIGFDRKAIKKVTGFEIPLENLLDTLVMGRLKNPERPNHKLESYGVELNILKGEYDGGWDAYNEDMRAYCHQDVVVTKAVYDIVKPVLGWGWSCDLEHRVAWLIDLQMENGYMLDVPAALTLAAEIQELRAGHVATLQRFFPPIYVATEAPRYPKKSINYKAKKNSIAYSVTAGAPYTPITLQEFNPGSEYHVARRLKSRYGWIAPLTEKGNPNITDEILSKLDFPEAKTLCAFAREDKRWLQLASPKKSNGTGGGWLHHADDRDRVHGYVNSNGAVTGRMTHSRPNSANIDKDIRLRSLWIPGPGFIQVGCDAEGIELRMLAHYLTPHDGGALTRQLLEGDKSLGTDAHSMNKKNTELFSRDGAKTLLYGSLYGAGNEKAGRIWIADWRESGLPESEWPRFAFTKDGRLRPPEVIGKTVKNRLVAGIKGFSKLIEGIKAAAEARGWVKGLDGRKIRVRSAHSALNSLLQGAGAIAMKVALSIYHDKAIAHGLVHGVHFGYLANVHDEVQQEVLPEHAEWVGKAFAQSITEAGELLKVRCRLDGAYEIGKNWYETH